MRGFEKHYEDKVKVCCHYIGKRRSRKTCLNECRVIGLSEVYLDYLLHMVGSLIRNSEMIKFTDIDIFECTF